MFGILTYSAVVLLGLVAVFFRKEVLLLKGRSFLIFNLIFTAVSVLAAAITGRLAENSVMIELLGAFLLVSILLRNKWLLFRYDPSGVPMILEESMSRILMPFEKLGQGYRLGKDPANQALLHIVVIFPKFAIMSFKARGRIRKVEVLQDLLNKRFNGIFPRPVIRL